MVQVSVIVQNFSCLSEALNFLTKLGIVMYRNKLKGSLKNWVAMFKVDVTMGNHKSNRNMTISVISSKLLILLQPNFDGASS